MTTKIFFIKRKIFVACMKYNIESEKMYETVAVTNKFVAPTKNLPIYEIFYSRNEIELTEIRTYD